MTLKNAGDLMIPLDRYPHIPYWFTLRQAIAELESAGLTVAGRGSLPRVVLVFNESYQLLGMVRRRDLLGGLDPASILDELQPRRMFGLGKRPPVDQAETLVEALGARSQRPVSDVMQSIGSAVDVGASLLEVARIMAADGASLVPVTREQQVVGVVRTVEVLHEIAALLECL
jgi:CBS domain-containing protein